MTEYIITEEELENIQDGDLADLKAVRSRPYNPQAKLEKVLDELKQKIKEYKPMSRRQDGYMFKDEIYVVIDYVKNGELRQSKDGEP